MGKNGKISIMEVSRTLAEYYLFIQSKYFHGIWQDEENELKKLWFSIALLGRSLLYKSTSSTHITVSGIVISLDRKYVLMNFHSKHKRWKHFGGHLEESDKTLAEAAMREILEETGLSKDSFVASPVLAVGDYYDRPLDVFMIDHESDAEDKTHTDIDIRYLFVTNGTPKPVVSTESNAIKWVPVSEVLSLLGDDPCKIDRLLAKALVALGDDTKENYFKIFGTNPGEASGFFGTNIRFKNSSNHQD